MSIVINKLDGRRTQLNSFSFLTYIIISLFCLIKHSNRDDLNSDNSLTIKGDKFFVHRDRSYTKR